MRKLYAFVVLTAVCVLLVVCDSEPGPLPADKAVTCSGAVGDTSDTIYLIGEGNHIYSAAKSGFDSAEKLDFVDTGVIANSIFVDKEVLYHCNKDGTFRGGEKLTDLWYLSFMVSNGRLYIDGSYIAPGLVDIDLKTKVQEIIKGGFPVAGDDGTLYMMNYLFHDTGTTFTLHRGQQRLFSYDREIDYHVFNDGRYFIYDNSCFYCQNGSIYRADFASAEPPAVFAEGNVIIAVGHGKVYYRAGQHLYVKSISGKGEETVYRDLIKDDLLVYVDSYKDVIYLIYGESKQIEILKNPAQEQENEEKQDYETHTPQL